MSSPAPRCVCIETPSRGDLDRNLAYADACMFDSLERGAAVSGTRGFLTGR